MKVIALDSFGNQLMDSLICNVVVPEANEDQIHLFIIALSVVSIEVWIDNSPLQFHNVTLLYSLQRMANMHAGQKLLHPNIPHKVIVQLEADGVVQML